MINRRNVSAPRRRLCVAALLGGLVATLVLAASAHAARNIVTGFADAVFRGSDEPTRRAALDSAVAEGAGVVRVDVLWRFVATGRPTDPRNPADPAYNFASIDAAVRDAHIRGLDVLFTVFSAPEWAEGPNRPPVSDDAPVGSWKPNPDDLADFATALATRFDGSYTPPGDTAALPSVRNFEAWNEPNLWVYISPQFDGRTEVGTDYYRKMLSAFYDAVHAANDDARVVLGGGAPYGDDPKTTPLPLKRTRPITFLRNLFCLTSALQPKSCPNVAKFDILGIHPINLSGGPNASAFHPDDATSADISNIIKVLHAAEDVGTVKGAHHPVWATEFWWESFPDRAPQAIPRLATHGRWIEQALYLFWRAGVDVAINLQLIDTPATGKDELDHTFQAGLYLADGTPKPAATSFRFPFVLDRKSKKKVFVWGKSPQEGKLAIEKKRGGGWRKVAGLNVKNNKVFTTTLSARGKGKYRAAIGDQTSLVWMLRE